MPNIPVTWLDEFNVTTTSGVGDPDIIQLANGNILVTWTSSDPDRPGASGDSDIIGQIFDPMGVAVGGAIRVNQGFFADSEIDADSAATTQGGFISVYEDIETDGTPLRFSIYGADGLVDFNGTIESDSNAGTQPNYRDPHVAVSSSTSALVVYALTDGAGTRIVGRIIDPSAGTIGAQIGLITFTANESQPDVAALTNGNYVITCTDFTGGDNRIAYRIIDSAGANVLSASFISATSGDTFSDSEPSVTALTGGGFVISYTDTDVNDTDISYRVFNAAGTEIGSGTAGVNSSNTTNLSNESVVAGLADGSFVIVLDADEAGVDRMEVTHVSATGTVLGSTSFAGTGTDPAVVDMDDGRFAVTWQSLDATGGIRMEILDTRDFANPTAVYNPEPNWQVGTIGNDTIVSDGNSDIVHGHLGNDDITDSNSSGLNQYFGDAGNDILRVLTQIDSDRWDGGAGSGDTINWVSAAIASGAVFDLAAGTAKLDANTEVMVGFENIVGSTFNDIMRGTSGVNVMKGASGNDVIRGGAGGDDLDGGSGVNTLDYTTSTAGVKIDITANTASGGHAQGDDILNFQNVYGSGFNDVLIGSSAGNILRGYAGVDTLEGRGGNDNIYGHEGDDVLRGEAGNDSLSGDDGIDKLNGGAGADALRGGVGADQFIFSNVSDSTVAASGRDTIYDFSRTQGDRINLSPIDANTDLVGNQAFKFIGSAAFNGVAGELRYGNSGGDTFISADIDGDAVGDLRIVLDRDLKMISADFVL